jgi:protocatechuate 3,4-dioxygenase beta subunit
MRPIALIALLVVLAAALIGGLLLVGRGTPPPDAGGSSIGSSAPFSPSGALVDTPIAEPALDQTGSEGREGVRPAALPTSSPGAPAAPAGASTAPKVVVRGRVVGSLGRPIEGATIFAAETNGFDDSPLDEVAAGPADWIQITKAATDADGRFEIRPAARSKVNLAVRAPGCAPLDREFVLTGSERDVGELVLDASIVLQGRVVDTAGRPIQGAKLARLSGSSPGFAPFARTRGAPVAETDAQGVFRVDQLAAGDWKLSVTHAEHPDHVEKGEGDRPGAVRSGIVITMEDGVEIQGRLVGAPAGAAAKLSIRATLAPSADGASGEPGPMEIRSSAPGSVRETLCAADGSFRLAGLKPGRNYRLTARDKDATRFFGRSRSAPTTARAGDRGVEITYRPESALVFQAVDATSGEPVVELSVRAGYGFSMPLLDENGQAVKRFPEGKVRFGDLPARPQRPGGGAAAGAGLKLTVESPGYRAFEKPDVVLLEGQDTDLGVIRLERAPVVKVLVLDAASGKPVADASVSIAEHKGESGGPGERRFSFSIGDGDDDDVFAAGASQRARTGEDGRASVTSLPGKTVLLRVRDDDHALYQSEPTVLPAAEDLELTVRLGPGGKVMVEVVDSHGTPVSGVEIDHQAPGEDGGQAVLSSEDARTDADGLLVFEHLTPGDHRFRLRQAQAAGFVTMGGQPARVSRFSRRGGGGDEEETGWSSVTVVENEAQTLRLVAPARGSLSGKVTEAGQPLANAELHLLSAGQDADPMPFGGNGRETRTDSRGEYLFDGVEEGEYRIEIQHPTRAMAHDAKARVREGANDLDIDLPVAIVEGRITGSDDKPLAGVRVRAERAPNAGEPRRRAFSYVMVMDDGGDEPEVTMGAPGGGTTASTDAEGRYTLRGVVPDVDLVVHATGKDVQPGKSEAFHVAPDGTRKNVDLKLEDGGSIEITVRRAGNGAPGRYLARATPAESGEPKIQMIGPGGSARLTGLKPGRWHVVLDPLMGPVEGGEEAQKLEQDVDVVVGQAAKASFESP